MTASLPTEDHVAINDTINRFFWCLDRSRADRVADLFTEAAKLDLGRPGAPVVQGRDAIVADMRDRPGGRVTRHLVSGVLIEPVATDQATVSILTAVYAGLDDGSQVRKEIGVSDTDLVMARDGDGKWRIADMKRTVVFKPQ